MFTVLRVEKPAEEGRLRGIWRRMKSRRIKVKEVDTPYGGYRLLTAYTNSPNWDKVAREAGPWARRMVLPRGLEPPPDCGIRRLDSREFSLAVLLQTCIQIVRRTKIPLYRKAVTLVDPAGQYQGMVRELLSYCMTVKVVTEEEERYRRLSQELMEDLGAGVICSESYGLCSGSMLVIAPEGEGAGQIRGLAPVMTMCRQPPACAAKVIGGLKIRLPEQMQPYIPPGIDPMDLAGALYMLGNWKELENLAAYQMYRGNFCLQISDITKYIEQHEVDHSIFDMDRTK